MNPTEAAAVVIDAVLDRWQVDHTKAPWDLTDPNSNVGYGGALQGGFAKLAEFAASVGDPDQVAAWARILARAVLEGAPQEISDQNLGSYLADVAGQHVRTIVTGESLGPG